MLKKLLALMLISLCFVSCDDDDDSGSSGGSIKLFHAVSTENFRYEKLTNNTFSEEEKYEGIAKYYELVAYWQSVKELRDYMVLAKTSLTPADVESLIASVDMIAPQRNQTIILNRLPLDLENEAELIKKDLLSLRDLLVQDYYDVTFLDLDLSGFDIVLDYREQTYQFYNDQHCGSGNEITRMKGLLTVDACDLRSRQIYEGVQSVSLNGVCTNLATSTGAYTTKDFVDACYTYVVQGYSDYDTSDEAVALENLSDIKLLSMYSDQHCKRGNIITRIAAPYSFRSCGYIATDIYNNGGTLNTQSYSIDNKCSNLETSTGAYTTEDMQFVCEDLWPQMNE